MIRTEPIKEDRPKGSLRNSTPANMDHMVCRLEKAAKPADRHFSSCIIYQDIAGNRAEDTKDQYRDDKAGDGGVVKQFHGITAQLVDCIGGEKETGAANSEISAFKCRKIYSCFPVDHTLGCR